MKRILTIILILASLAQADIVKNSIKPQANNTYNLGSSSFRWGTVFAVDLNASNRGTMFELLVDTTTLAVNLPGFADLVGIGTVTPNEQLEITANFRLPSTTSSTGIIYMDATTWLHRFGASDNVYLGIGAGNLTNVNSETTAIGSLAMANTSDASNFVTALGASVLENTDQVSTGTYIGYRAGYNAMNDSAGDIAIGFTALQDSNQSAGNIAIGDSAMNDGFNIVTGAGNSAVGGRTMESLTSGVSNNAFGQKTLQEITDQLQNNAFGDSALENNTASEMTAFGHNALEFNTSGTGSSAFGWKALEKNTGNNNSAFGHNAGNEITSGVDNTLMGFGAGGAIIGGNSNVAVGSGAGVAITGGSQHVLIGTGAGAEITVGTGNVLIGWRAGNSMVSGPDYNVAVGFDALLNETTVDGLVAIGKDALRLNNQGTSNVGVGARALELNVTGGQNTAVGQDALSRVTLSNNTAIGRSALEIATTAEENTVVGSTAGNRITTGDENTLLGFSSGDLLSQGSRNIFLGHQAGTRQTTNSNLLIIDNQDRINIATEATDSLIYGVFNATVGNQTLSLNAMTTIDSAIIADLTANQLVATGASSELISVGTLSDFITGTADQISVTDDGDGTLTLAITSPLILPGNLEGADNFTAGNADNYWQFHDPENYITSPAGTFVGIGTDTPTEIVHIKTGPSNDVLTGIVIQNDRTGPTAGISIDFINHTTDTVKTARIIAKRTTGVTSNSQLQFWNFFGGSLQQAMVINEDGNVGINTTSPGEKLEVAGNILTEGIALTFASELTISSGAVTATQGHHSIDTEGDAANDDLDTINGGIAGEILFILPADDGRTVRIRHGVGNIYLKHQVESKSFSFSSPAGSSGIFYAGGYYNWTSTDGNLTQASLSVTHSAANSPSACHIGIVAGGAGVVDAGVVKITVSGTTIDDEGNRASSQTVDLVADITTLDVNDYVETTEKWIGQVTIALATASGSPVNFNVDINYGCSKYEDFGNQAFTINVLECVGLAGANDSGFNLRLFHHSSAGWTYAATGFVPGGTVLANMNTDYSPEQNLANGESYAYKRVDLNTDISGDDSEGLILEITTSANKAVEIMDIHFGVHTAPNFAYMATTKQHLIFMKHGPNWLEL